MAMLTIVQCLRLSSELEGVSESSRLDTELLLAQVLQKDRAFLYAWPEYLLSKVQQTAFLSLVERRKKGEPVAYILGCREFWGLPLGVNASTLIPRPDTETLVETALSYFSDDAKQKRTVVDLGTGTGAVALAIATEKPAWQIIAVDNSVEACRLAEKNRESCGISNVNVVCGYWLSGISVPVDMIVSNPPYIEDNDPHLQQGDVRFEPRSALVSGKAGLADIEVIIHQAKSCLLSGGRLLFEHGYQQFQAVQTLLQEQGFIDCMTVNDLNGHPRVTGGIWYDRDARDGDICDRDVCDG